MCRNEGSIGGLGVLNAGTRRDWIKSSSCAPGRVPAHDLFPKAPPPAGIGLDSKKDKVESEFRSISLLWRMIFPKKPATFWHHALILQFVFLQSDNAIDAADQDRRRFEGQHAARLDRHFDASPRIASDPL